MARKLSYDNPLFDDPTFRQCLELALESDCKKGKYGCLAIYRKRIIAATCNKTIDALRDWCAPECIRKSIPSRTESMIGACAHAEELALARVRDSGVNIGKVKFFVAGFRSNGLAYIKPEAYFTCIRCATQLYLHGVKKIFVPVKIGWGMLTGEESLIIAKDFARKIRTLENFTARQS